MPRPDAESPMTDVTESWSMNFTRRGRDCGDVHRTVEMSWENRTPAQVMENLNAFLVAVRVPLRVVSARSAS